MKWQSKAPPDKAKPLVLVPVYHVASLSSSVPACLQRVPPCFRSFSSRSWFLLSARRRHDSNAAACVRLAFVCECLRACGFACRPGAGGNPGLKGNAGLLRRLLTDEFVALPDAGIAVAASRACWQRTRGAGVVAFATAAEALSREEAELCSQEAQDADDSGLAEKLEYVASVAGDAADIMEDSTFAYRVECALA
eukprot:GHVT01085487.1.p1 GENE.GHVT01085487.1~~GHVT01085487.1.p1  ORF type:complete len:195 (-),score=46.79 GHVT01085487.1:879-1463(-)